MDVMMPNKDVVEVCREIMEFATATRGGHADGVHGGGRDDRGGGRR